MNEVDYLPMKIDESFNRCNYDIIMICTSRWDDSFSSVGYSLAKEFSKKNRVFYVDHPFSVKDYFSFYNVNNVIKLRQSALLYGKNQYNKINSVPGNLTIVTPRLTLPINWLKQGKVYDKLSRLNNKVVIASLRSLLKDYKIKDYILFNSYDPFYLYEIPDDIKPTVRVYQTIDDISQEAYTARHGVKLEQKQIANADFTLATSSELTRLMSRFTNKVYCMPNAADFSIFQKAINEKLEKPQELLGVTSKVICYTGNIGTRINYNLLSKIAAKHADKLLLMVGPLTTDDYQKAGLDLLPNVKFTGAKDISELPRYLQHSDCAIIPFEYSVLTKSIYPLKINEYLTAGKPVVATAFSEDIKSFGEVVYIAESEAEFLEKIDQAIGEDNETRINSRIETAKSNTWEARVNQFWSIVKDVVKSN